MSLKTLSELYQKAHEIRSALEPAFGPETRYLAAATEPASSGHCTVAAIFVQKELGGDFVSATVNDASHWFNRITLQDNLEFDLDVTGDQFGLPCVQLAFAGDLYVGTRLRNTREITSETWERAHILEQRVQDASRVSTISLQEK